jgi:Protein of unknown function (DUF4231)
METPIKTTSMTPGDYLKLRVEDQIGWYTKKSATNKKWFYACQTITIICSALIPFLIGFSNGELEYLKYIAGVLGVIVAIFQGLLGLKKFQENWMTYRGTAEMLQREKFLFLNQIGETIDEGYDFKTFVYKAEQIMSSENTNWVSLQGMKEKSKEA